MDFILLKDIGLFVFTIHIHDVFAPEWSAKRFDTTIYLPSFPPSCAASQKQQQTKTENFLYFLKSDLKFN